MSSFIEDCLSGAALLDDIDDYVDTWHERPEEEPLYKFLGFTKREYALWVADPEILPFVVTAHRRGENVDVLLGEFESLPLAARSSGPDKAVKLIRWLKREGLWDE